MKRLGILSVLALALAGLLLLPLARSARAQKRGGIVNWMIYEDPARLDFFTVAALGEQQAVAGIYSGLLQYSPDKPAEIIPDLAVKYDELNGGKSYVFHLRHGVTWHDGKPFTAADVKATYDHMFDPNTKARRCASLMKPIVTDWKVEDDYTVRFNLQFAAPTFIPAVASAWCRIAAKHILDKYKDLQSPEAQIGTGPFKLKRYDRGSLIEWERNPNYYNPKLPYVDGVKQYVLVGMDRMVAAAKAGQIDTWDTWPPLSKTRADEIKSARGDAANVYLWPINTVWAVHMNPAKAPFDNPDVRRAVSLALDRWELMEKGLEGAGTPCAILDPKLYGDYALPTAEVDKMPGCRKDKKAEDIAEAKRLVEKHYPNGVDFEVVTRSVGNYVDRVQVVADQLRKIGLRGHIKTYESAAGYATYAKGDFTMIGTQDSAMFLPDPSGLFSLLYNPGAAMNWEKWNDPKLEAMTDKALHETNHAKRVAEYHSIQRYLLEKDNATPIIGWVAGWFYTDKRLQNYRRANTVYDNNTFQDVWLEH
jgi:peptide/nickel transport system substrate-binding protein